MHRFETIDLGSYRGDEYFVVGFVEPEPVEGEKFDPDEDADNYGIVLVLSTSHPQASNAEIVRLDTAHGQEPHVDRVYLPRDAKGARQFELGSDFTYQRMKRYLLTYWKRFADRYVRYNQ